MTNKDILVNTAEMKEVMSAFLEQAFKASSEELAALTDEEIRIYFKGYTLLVTLNADTFEALETFIKAIED